MTNKPDVIKAAMLRRNPLDIAQEEMNNAISVGNKQKPPDAMRSEIQKWRDDAFHKSASIVKRHLGTVESQYIVSDILALSAAPVPPADGAGERETQRQHQGAAHPDETCQQRNMRMGWGCKCHGETFCPDLEFVGYEDDQPIFKRKEQAALSPSPAVAAADKALEEIWNATIEDVAIMAENRYGNYGMIANEIRKLKK